MTSCNLFSTWCFKEFLLSESAIWVSSQWTSDSLDSPSSEGLISIILPSSLRSRWRTGYTILSIDRPWLCTNSRNESITKGRSEIFVLRTVTGACQPSLSASGLKICTSIAVESADWRNLQAPKVVWARASGLLFWRKDSVALDRKISAKDITNFSSTGWTIRSSRLRMAAKARDSWRKRSTVDFEVSLMANH